MAGRIMNLLQQYRHGDVWIVIRVSFELGEDLSGDDLFASTCDQPMI